MDVADNSQEKALVMACSGGHVDVVKLLLARRSRAKAEQPVVTAATTDNDNNSKHCDDEDDEISSSLKIAQWGGNTALMELLRSYM